MEDVNYWKYGTYEITMEIGCCITPPASELDTIWDENKNSLIEFTKAANMGIRGLVTYRNGLPAPFLSIQFDSREPIFKTTELGEFYAMLLPGTYNMTVLLNCDPIFSKVVHIDGSKKLLVTNVVLEDIFYFRAFYYKLDKYAIFCTKSKAPVDCSSGKEVPDKNGSTSLIAMTSVLAVLGRILIFYFSIKL